MTSSFSVYVRAHLRTQLDRKRTMTAIDLAGIVRRDFARLDFRGIRMKRFARTRCTWKKSLQGNRSYGRIFLVLPANFSK